MRFRQLTNHRSPTRSRSCGKQERLARGFAHVRSSRYQLRAHLAASIDGELRNFFDAHHSGPGIWKWTHYFDAYVRHLSRFVGQDVSRPRDRRLQWRQPADVARLLRRPMLDLLSGHRAGMPAVRERPHARLHRRSGRPRILASSPPQRPPTQHCIDDGGHRAEQHVVAARRDLVAPKHGTEWQPFL